MLGTDIVVGLVIAVGLVGIVVPMLPGTVLVGGAILAWAAEVGTTTGWVVFALAAVLLVVGTIVKYLVPGRRMKADGIPNRTLLAGAVAGIVGFFVIPVVGLPIGFVLGIYLAERLRLNAHGPAWTATKSALRQVGVSVLIELTAALAAAGVWLVGALVV